VLSDGQTWIVPRPMIYGFAPVMADDGTVRLTLASDQGDAFDTLLDTFAEAEDVLSETLALTKAVYHLLLKNYDLSFADLRKLLVKVRKGDPGHDECLEMWKALADVVLGRGPKPSPAT
jgi:hypothetical protein